MMLANKFGQKKIPALLHPARLFRAGLASAAFAWCAQNGAAQAADPASLDYLSAEQQFLSRSDAIDAAGENVRAKQAQEKSTRTLHRPDLDFELQLLEYQKTLYLPLGPLEPLAADYGIADPLEFRQELRSIRPILTASVPLYTGGRIDATRDGAQAELDAALAERDLTTDEGLVQLVQAYFGQQLAERALGVRRDVLTGLEAHFDEVRHLEEVGLATKAQRLQAEVARDDASREYQEAIARLATANVVLAGLLRAPAGIRPLSPLFVISAPLAPVEAFSQSAMDNHPEIKRLDALAGKAEAGIDIEESKRKPTVFGFAQYNLDREDALLTDPDWAVGIGMRYKFFSGADRKQGVAAARFTAEQVRAGRREARTRIGIGVAKAWYEVEAARKRFLLLDTAIVSAEESLRLQKLAYREQQATSLDVVDAELGLGRARIRQDQAAYDYVIALAELLSASGQMSEFSEYQTRADRIVP